jgi:hypothetical protein
MVILLNFDVVMKAPAARELPCDERYPVMDETKHSGIRFFDARPHANFYGHIAG